MATDLESSAGVSRTRTRALAVGVLIASLVCGIVIGAAADRFLLFRQHRLVPRAGSFVSRHIVDHLDHELSLSAGQRQQIELIVQRRHQRINAIWEHARPQAKAEMEATAAEIEQVLNPVQQDKFRKLHDRARHARRWMDGGPR